MFNLFSGLFGGGSCNVQAANVCFQAIDPEDRPICGAVYRLTCACGKYLNGITGRNGCVTFCGVCPGTYKLTQVAVPFGFLVDSTPHTVVVSPRCSVKIDGWPMRCFQSLIKRDNTPQAQSEPPAVGAITTATDVIQGTGEAGCKIKVEFPGNCCCCTCVRRNGTWSIDVPENANLQPGEIIFVTQCCPCMLPSEPVQVTVVLA